jgi:site-specific DNA-cytosine methylase
MRRSEKRGGNGIVGFSGYDKLDQDPRNDLVLRFLEIAHALSPKIIMIENVPQMLIHGHNGKLGGMSDNVKSLLREMGYSVLASVVNAADYGVPQLRERVVFVASRIGPASFPEATHRNPEALDLFRRMCPPWRTVRDAIADLPCDPPHRDDWGGGPLGLYGRATPSEYSRLLRSHTAFPYNHVTRAYQQRIIRIIREMGPGETWDAASERMQARYEKLVERNQSGGETSARARKRLIEEGKINPVFFRRYYWSAYTRLDWGRPALTITANANFLGSGRFTHPDRDRGITVREAARLQSFDDDFAFITRAAGRQSTERIGVGMDMIGEAVPPLLGEAFGRHFAGILDLVNGAGQNCGATDPERRAGAYDERRSVQDSR